MVVVVEFAVCSVWVKNVYPRLIRDGARIGFFPFGCVEGDIKILVGSVTFNLTDLVCIIDSCRRQGARVSNYSNY